jgi:hypothetical protein
VPNARTLDAARFVGARAIATPADPGADHILSIALFISAALIAAS